MTDNRYSASEKKYLLLRLAVARSIFLRRSSEAFSGKQSDVIRRVIL